MATNLRFAKPAPPKATRPSSILNSNKQDAEQANKVEQSAPSELLPPKPQTPPAKLQQEPESTVSKSPLKPLPSTPEPKPLPSTPGPKPEPAAVAVLRPPPAKPQPKAPEVESRIAPLSKQPPRVFPRSSSSADSLPRPGLSTSLESSPSPPSQQPTGEQMQRSISEGPPTAARPPIPSSKPKLPFKPPELAKANSSESIDTGSVFSSPSNVNSIDQNKPHKPSLARSIGEKQLNDGPAVAAESPKSQRVLPIVQLPGPLPPAPSEVIQQRPSPLVDRKPFIHSEIKTQPETMGARVSKLVPIRMPRSHQEASPSSDPTPTPTTPTTTITATTASTSSSNTSSSEMTIHSASENGQFDAVVNFIKQQVDINSVDSKGRTPLHHASARGHFDIVKLLVDNNAYIGLMDSKRQTAEMIAKQANQLEIGLYLALEQAKRMKAEEIDLSGYAIQGIFQVDGFDQLNNLTSLNLSSNQLSDLNDDVLSNLTSLTNLDLSNNKFVELSPNIGKLTELRSLDISNNHLDLLPAEIGILPNLKKFHWKNNPLRFIPASVIKSGTSALLRYLAQLKECSTEWRRLKLLVVGEENVGKTSILRCFRSKPITPNVSTNGIDIQTCQIDSRVSFSAWDFGGQEVFYPTHLFFLTGRSIYLVVFNLLLPNIPRVEYWLKQIQLSTMGAHSPIIMVGTHADECAPDRAQNVMKMMKRLAQRFPNVEDVLVVGCRTQEGIAALKSRLRDIALESVLLKKMVPGTWESIDIRLQCLREDGLQTLKKIQFQSMAAQCGIEKKDCKQVIQFLRDVGTLLYFNLSSSRGGGGGTLRLNQSGAGCDSVKNTNAVDGRMKGSSERSKATKDRSTLGQLLIIDPQWLADIMSKLISFNHKWIREDGILLHTNLCHIWEKQSQRSCELYLNLLESFEIALPLRGDPARSLIPSLLAESRPTDFHDHWKPFLNDTDRMTEFGRFYEFSFFPLGLFGRLLVRFLHIKGAVIKCQWKNGVVIGLDSDKNQLGLVEYDTSKCRLNVFVRGLKTLFPTLLRLVIDEIDTLLESVYDVRSDLIRIFIPCLHCRTKKSLQDPYLFTTDELLKAIAINQPFVYCHGINSPTRAVQVNLLAPDIAFQELKVLDKVEIEQEIGKGGFGVIYKGTYAGRVVAIKELKLDQDIEESELAEKYKEFRFEVHTMSLLEHPNIVKFYGLTLNPFRMIMEYLPYGDLFHFLHNRSNKITWRMTLRICLDIAKGVHYMHSITPPVVHRDIRSPNILLADTSETADEIVKIADFGLARTVAPTTAGALGTWQWAAPEVIDSSNKFYDEKADIYSMGMVFWEVASRSDPFDEYRETEEYGKYMGKDDRQQDVWLFRLQEIKQAIVSKNLRPLIPLSTNPKLGKLIQDCWQTNPKHRPTASQVIEELASLLGMDPKESLRINYAPNFTIAKKLPKVQPITMPRQMITSTDQIVEEPTLVAAEDLRPISMHYCLGHVWIGCSDGLLAVWNVESQRRVQDTRLHASPINDIVSASNRIFTASEIGSIHVWDPNSLSALQELKAHGINQVIKCLVIVNMTMTSESKNSTRLWSFSPSERLIHVWNIDGLTKLSTINTGQHFPISSAAYVPHSGHVWAGTHRDVLVIDPQSLQIIGVLEGHRMRINCINFTPEEVWTCSEDGDICIWQPESGDLLKRLKVHTSAIRALVRWGIKIITCSSDQQIIVWNLKELVIISDDLTCMVATPSAIWTACDRAVLICNMNFMK